MTKMEIIQAVDTLNRTLSNLSNVKNKQNECDIILNKIIELIGLL